MGKIKESLQLCNLCSRRAAHISQAITCAFAIKKKAGGEKEQHREMPEAGVETDWAK